MNARGPENTRTGRDWRSILRSTARAATIGLAVLAASAGGASAAVLGANDAGSVIQATGTNDTYLATNVHDANHVAVTSVPVGSTVHFQMSVTGFVGVPTGQVGIRLYGNGTCSGVPAYGYGRTLVNGSLDATDITLMRTEAATWSVQVQYLGDSNYMSKLGACKTFAFTKVTPQIVLKIHDADHNIVDAVPFNEKVHAYARLKGTTAGTAENWILFRAWANGDCSGDNYVYTTGNLEGNEVDGILPLGFDAPGERSYKARYSGDGSYNAVWSDCVSVTATKIAPKLTFGLHTSTHQSVTGPVATGWEIHPTFGVSGPEGQPTGDVTIHLYDGDSCSGEIATFTTGAVSSFDQAGFAKSVRLDPGYRSWQAFYAGDDVYTSALSACLSARWLSTPEIGLTAHDAGHDVVTSITLGETIHFRVTAVGQFGTVTGVVNIRRGGNSSCGSSSLIGGGTLSGGVLHDPSIDLKPASVGTYWFQAIYKGDGEYIATGSNCLAVVVKSAPVPTATPGPTATPAPKSTLKPTPVPTPDPTSTPTPDATDVPGATEQPAASADPTAAPATAPTPVPTTDSQEAAPAGPQPTDAIGAGTTPPSGGANGDGMLLPVIGFVGLLIVLGGLGYWLGTASRRRRQAATKPA